jgi:hypothetical protein
MTKGEEEMRRYLIIRSGLAALLLGSGVGVAAAQNTATQEYDAQLSGFFEIGPINNNTGAVLTNGSGKLTLVVEKNVAEYSLSYSGLTSNVTQAHIHFGKVHVAGGVFVFLCTNLGNGPAGTPACPPAGGTVTGTITAASILAVATQNVPAGNFNVLLDALASDTAYANVHTANFPGGEIRGQVEVHEEDGGQGKGKSR